MLFLLPGMLEGATTLLPGVIYYDVPENLTGKLTFLLRNDTIPERNSETSASIYELNLSEKKLIKITDSPKGLLVPSSNGDIFCVVYRPGNWFHSEDTNVFIYLAATRQARTLSLKSPPKETLIVDSHIFFTVKDQNETELLDYDITRDHNNQVRFLDASRWQYQLYQSIHIPRDRTNTLHFYYSRFGKRLENGKDYNDGYYSLNIRTGEIQWFSELLNDEDNDRKGFKAVDGNFIFFQGEDPTVGFKLISSPWNFSETKRRDPKGEKVKVIKAFSRLRCGGYVLSQMSPDGRFAFVRLEEPVSPKSIEQAGWMNTYFLVDVSNGKTRVLLKDQVQQKTKGSMSPVQWLGKGLEPTKGDD